MNIVQKHWIFFLPALTICSIFSQRGVEASADTYLGCYDESGTDEIFITNTGIALSNLTTSNLTTDGCREHCRKNLIYSFAGLWGGTHCYCAERVVNKDGIAKVNDSLCHLSCPGEPTEFCGGSSALYLYSVYSVCSRGLYGRNCTNNCNCIDNKRCTVSGFCRGNECAAGWLLNSTIPNRWKCSTDIDECKTECNPTNSTNCHNCSLAEHQICKNTKGSFQCICRNGYNETNHGTCEDIDECTARTHNCTQHCSNTEGSYTCSCWAGYELERRFSCKDIDECLRNTSGCEQKCENTIGNYTCGCNDGFRQSTTNRLNCDEIDECAEGSSNCAHNCINTIGGYNCSCRTGYELLSNGYTCNDINECDRRTSDCQQICFNTDGSYTCGCNIGFRQNTTNRMKCDDIDECAEGNSSCTHNCINTIGRYNCSCRSGYELHRNGYTCNDVDECKRGTSSCEQKCNNTDGSYICDCNYGFRINTTNTSRCDDIDECTEGSSGCGQICNNTIGNYSCGCKPGYDLDIDHHKCNDIDECYRNTSGCSQNCKNNDGSYECECNIGFELGSNNHTCEDIDECDRKMSRCNQNCSNTYGWYNCSCYTIGYRLENESNCIDVDECTDNNGGCQHYCSNTVGSFGCSCRPGYRIAEKIGETYNCTDIDECAENSSSCIHNCTNTIGGYNCSCYSGFLLHSDLKDCTGLQNTAMDAIIKSRICVLITTAFCSIFYASRVEASPETYLGCYREYGAEAVFVIPSSNTFNGSTPDGCREECRKDLIYSFAGLWGGTTCYCASGLNEKLIKQVNNSICYRSCPIEPAEFCGGSNASYTFSVYSVCPRGFYGRDCTNECNCRDNKNCTLQGVCPGNECAAGWNLNSTIPNRPRCSIEIDECAVNTTNCEHACINMHGSYYCVCQPGYKLHHDRHSCVDVDECEIPCSSLKTTQCYQCKEFNECQNTIGSFTCRCKSGYVFDLQQDTCEDIDECSRQMANCSHTCTNTNGSYECGCFEGFELEDDSHRCVVLESGLWSLVAGLGLGAGVLFFVVVALAITVCQLLSARNLKVTGKEAEEESFAKISRQNEYAQLANQQATRSQHPPNEYDHLDNSQATGSRPPPPSEYDQLDRRKATGSGPNEFSNTADHSPEFQEDAYFEIA